MAREDRKEDRNPEDEKKSARRAEKAPEKSAENRNLSAYSRIVKKVDAAGIKPSKPDKNTVFQVTATIPGTVTHTGILEAADDNSIQVVCKKPRSSKYASLTFRRKDVLTQHGVVVGKPTQVVVAGPEVIQEVLGKVTFSENAVVVKTEDGSSIEFNTNKVRLDIVKA